MIITPTAIPEVKLITPNFIGDERGRFAEVFRADRLAAVGIDGPFVQHNQSLSRSVGTIRGLHFQRPPRAQAKLVRVIRGRIFDVAVDIRRASPTFGRHVSAVLTADGGEQLFVPEGFAHGFCTLDPDTEVLYLTTDYYAAECDQAVLWCDPAIGVEWPVTADRAVLSARDRAAPPLAALGPGF